jgi:transposase-like protein
MDRHRLKGYLDEGLSLRQIGTLTGLDHTTVAYWVAKHGLIANGRARQASRGDLDTEFLEMLIEGGATMREMADALEVNPATIQYWLRKLGLHTKNGVGRRPRVKGRKLPVTTATCQRHGETQYVLQGHGGYRCKRCRAEAVARRRRRIKELLVKEAGGRCLLCGYDRCRAALHFHHVDRSTKSFGLAGRGITRAIDEVRREAQKCILVCSNCHAEIEAGITTVPLEFPPAIAPG